MFCIVGNSKETVDSTEDPSTVKCISCLKHIFCSVISLLVSIVVNAV